tara:strand:- start:4475 stop:5137 length:663 start_codon:yes stop_codon:yes gene_type:complete
MKNSISLSSLLLFVIPTLTLLICHQMHANYTSIITIPFIDGKVSISLIGRQDYTIKIFKPGFFIYAIISIFFYYELSNYALKNGIKNKFKLYGILANFFLCIYIIALGNRESNFYEIARRLAIIFYILNMYINHIYLIKILKNLKIKKKINLKKIYLVIFYIILSLMTILIIIGSPWINPLFKYPYELKNIIEWNYFFLIIVFYIPVAIIFSKFNKKILR